MKNPRILLDHSDVRAVALDNVIVTAWHKAPRTEVIELLERAVTPYHSEHPEGAVLLIVPTRDAPDDAARRALQAFLLRLGKALLGAAVILPLAGLKGTILRGVATGVVAAMRLPFPVKLVGSPSDASSYATETLGTRLSSSVPAHEVERLLRDATAPFSGAPASP